MGDLWTTADKLTNNKREEGSRCQFLHWIGLFAHFICRAVLPWILNRYFHLTPLAVLLPADGFQWGCDRGADSLRKRTGPREGRQADEGWSNELRNNFLERDRKMMFTKKHPVTARKAKFA